MVFLISFVNALGVIPADSVIDFIPHYQNNHSLTILNGEDSNGDLKLEVSGELARYIHISKSLIHQEPGKDNRVFFQVKLPESLEVGRRKGRISIVSEDSSSGFSARLKLNHNVFVDVPLEYARLLFNFDYDNQTFIVNLKNPRPDFIYDLDIDILLKDRNRKIITLSEKDMLFTPLEEITLSKPLNLKREGEFEIEYEVNSKEFSFNNSKPFIFGEINPEIEFKSLTLFQGRINKITGQISSNWNLDLDSKVVGKLILDNDTISTYATEVFEVEGYSEELFELYIDCTDLEIGEYDFKVIINHGSIKKEINEKIIIETFDEKLFKRQVNFIPIITIIIVVIALIILIWLLKRK